MNLDDTLAAWAATVHPPDATAGGIYRRIVAAPAPPASRWGRSAGPGGGTLAPTSLPR